MKRRRTDRAEAAAVAEERADEAAERGSPFRAWFGKTATKVSDTWQLVINTGTTIVTFLMVFLIQNTQNRDAKAVHLKLDEIIRALKGARNELVDLEELSDEDLKKLEQQFQRIRKKAEHDGNHAHAKPPELR